MDSSLLAVLRYLRQKYRPCYVRAPVRGLKLFWEVFKDLIAVTCTPMPFIRNYNTGAILLASDSHKTREIRSFITGILEPARFATISYSKRIPIFSFLLPRLFLKKRIGKSLLNYSWLRRRYPAWIGRDFLKFFLYQAVAECHFSQCPPAAIAIVSDLAARRIAFARAAGKHGTAVIYYQFGHHHNFRPPFHVDYGICMNNLLADRLKQTFNSTIVARTSFNGTLEGLVFRPVPESPVVGIATNVFPRTEGINNVADYFRKKIGASRVYYKPHPRNTDADIRDVECEIFDKDAPAETFSDQIDLCICGDTTAVMKILLTGTPCLYLPGVDGRRRDRYGYVKDAAILGAESLEEINIDNINFFYMQPENLKNIFVYVKNNMTIDISKDNKQEFINNINYIIS